MTGRWFARLPTGLKMLLILSAALLPLGMIAVFTSIEAGRSARLAREAEARVVATASAQQLTDSIARMSTDLRRVADLVAADPDDERRCRRALDGIAPAPRVPIGFAIARPDGSRICATALFSAAPITTPFAGLGTEVRILDKSDRLRFGIVGREGLIATGEIASGGAANLLRVAASSDVPALLRQGEAIIPLGRFEPDRATGAVIATPVAGGQLLFETYVRTEGLRAIEVLLVMLPILMWVAAALVGWLVVDRLVLKPLAALQAAVAGYRVGDRQFRVPETTSPAFEIRRLGQAFADVTARLVAHERDLEQGLARQTKLTREVHHRVKNNLQVVSSLINLHARGVADPDVAAAYASIQRRVDALAVVHRNHYAELEENRGVGLRALLSELAANLRGTAPPGAAHMAVTLDLDPVWSNQDVAVSVAFLVTELVEMAMACDPDNGVTIQLDRGEAGDHALLTVTAPGLAQQSCSAHPSFARFNRVVEGLARQLRATLVTDPAQGRYSIEIAIVA